MWPSDAMWLYSTCLTLVLVMACWLTAPSHCQNQCWEIINRVFCHQAITRTNVKKSALGPFGTITLTELMLRNHQWGLLVPIHYRNQYWEIVSWVFWHSPGGNLTGNVQYSYPWYELKITKLRLHPHLSGTNELIHVSTVTIVSNVGVSFQVYVSNRGRYERHIPRLVQNLLWWWIRNSSRGFHWPSFHKSGESGWLAVVG